MIENKICFICCVNDEDTYSECTKYINNLNIPDGMNIEIRAIREANSITQGYNQAMIGSNAKYKIYLHQDVFIINKNFICDILEVFRKHQDVGMLGVIGGATIPTSGKWWESSSKYGKVYESHTGKMELLKHKDVQQKIKEVKAIDGLIMATQYDIKWREDLFNGWHFYDISQCVEFQKHGYKVAVVDQNEPWCIHDCGFVETIGQYDNYREIFIKEYSKDIFPLCSIMITAYNRPKYFKLALESAINQTYLNTEIIICDNSTNNEVKELVQNYNYENIRYYKNETELEVIENFNKCISLSKSNYVCFLMDDDLYSVDKLNIMMNYFIEDELVSIVTSHRQVIDESGNGIQEISATQRLFDRTTLINNESIKELTIKTRTNFWGETTTPIFRKDLLENGKFGFYEGTQYSVISDLVTWIKMSERGKLIYLPETLSYFRIHNSQDQNRTKTKYRGYLETFSLVNQLLAKKSGYENINDYYNLLLLIKNNIENIIIHKEIKDIKEIRTLIENSFIIVDDILFRFKHKYTVKDVYIKSLFQELTSVLKKAYNISYKFCNLVLDEKDNEIINKFIGAEDYKNYIINLYNYKDENFKGYIKHDCEIGENDIKYIAFYLPQYHTIPENDKWWEKGFTEWTNVTRAVPLFTGHYQPHLPYEIGFYDLNNESVMEEQIKIAKNYGIYGFCFHYYWFSGKRLLEKPLNNFINNKKLDFPFCLCWANENWTRRWDGAEESVLIKQEHTTEDDIRFIEDISIFFKDKRYIKIDNKPLLIIYRADIIPNLKNKVELWRKICKQKGYDVYIVGANTFNFNNPKEYGFDAAVEFPPHKMLNYNSRIDGFKTVNKDYNGYVFDYSRMVEEKEYLEDTNYKLFKTAFPSWDNTARKPNSSFIFWNSSPDLYREWLEDISKHTKERFSNEERFVFINAWNEWAEGAHLEPDRRFGYSYLQATYEALINTRTE